MIISCFFAHSAIFCFIGSTFGKKSNSVPPITTSFKLSLHPLNASLWISKWLLQNVLPFKRHHFEIMEGQDFQTEIQLRTLAFAIEHVNWLQWMWFRALPWVSGTIMKYLNIVLENRSFHFYYYYFFFCIKIRFRCNILFLVNKIFVTSSRTSKVQNISTFKRMSSKKLTCRTDNC